MAQRNLITGLILVVLGLIFLGVNFGWFTLEWSQLARYWPVLIIILGINLLVGRANPVVTTITVLLLAVAVPLALVNRIQDRVEGHSFWNGWDDDQEEEEPDASSENRPLEKGSVQDFSEPMLPTLQNASLTLKGGAARFVLRESTDQLITAHTTLNIGQYRLQNTASEASNEANLVFSMSDTRRDIEWKGGKMNNQVDLRLNTAPLWDLHAEIGAGKADFDLTPYRIRTLTLETGVTDVDIKLGDRADISEVDVDAGLAQVRFRVPQTVGCRIKHDGLSMKDFDGFEKVGDYYQTANYEASPKKINITFDSGLAKLEVERY